MGLPLEYSSSSNVSKETGESTASILRAAAWLRRRCARGQRSLTAGISLFVVSAVGALAATDYGDYSSFGNASSTTVSTIRIGATTDSEASVTTSSLATGDDNTGTDDEDGVTMPVSITQRASVTIPVSVFNNNTANRVLQGWIDFNNNGTFDNSDVGVGGERIYNAAVPANAAQQTVNVTFTVPSGASPGSLRGVRFRFSDSAATTPTSSGAAGEIEDYTVTIACSTIGATSQAPSRSISSCSLACLSEMASLALSSAASASSSHEAS